MIVTLVTIFTLAGQNFTRREVMPNLPACWSRAPERMDEMRKQHPEIDMIGVGCTVNTGEPA